jgi:hypothetical protein
MQNRNLAGAMGQHSRLAARSPLLCLSQDLTRHIMTKASERPVADWLEQIAIAAPDYD